MPEYPLWDPAAQRPDLGHYVYHFYDSEDVLLYVGSTGNLWTRIGQHVADREWWPDVAWDRTVAELIDAATCPGRGCPLSGHVEMLRYEEQLIKDLRPRHNSLMTGYCRSGRHLFAEVGKTGNRTCPVCLSERNHQRYETNREERLTDANMYYQANRGKVAKYRQRPDVKARNRARMKEYRDNPENRARANALRRRKYAERKAAPDQLTLED